MKDCRVRVEALPEERDEEGPLRYVDVTKEFEGDAKVVTNDHRLRIKLIFPSPEEMEKGKFILSFARHRFNWRVYAKVDTTMLDYCKCDFQSQLVPSMLCQIRPKLFHRYVPKGEAANIKILVWWDSLGKSVHQTFLCVRFISEYPIFQGRKYATPMEAWLGTWQDDSKCSSYVAILCKEILQTEGIRYSCDQITGCEVGINTIEVHYTADRKAFVRFSGVPYLG